MGLQILTNSLFVLCMSINLTFYGLSFADQTCDIKEPFKCRENETCLQQKDTDSIGTCVCLMGYERDKKGCVPITPTTTPTPTVVPPQPHPQPTPSRGAHITSRGTSWALWVLVPCFLVAVTGGLVLAARKYMWVDRLYQMRIRRYNNVLNVRNQARCTSSVI